MKIYRINSVPPNSPGFAWGHEGLAYISDNGEGEAVTWQSGMAPSGFSHRAGRVWQIPTEVTEEELRKDGWKIFQPEWGPRCYPESGSIGAYAAKKAEQLGGDRKEALLRFAQLCA